MADAPLRANYDDIVDVLYLSVGHAKPSSYQEDDSGLVWRLLDDGTVFGVTVFDFVAEWQPQAEALAATVAKRLGVPREMAREALHR